jgi:hypothetical protein
MSSQKKCAVTGNSDSAVDPNGECGLMDATMGNACNIGDRQGGVKVCTVLPSSEVALISVLSQSNCDLNLDSRPYIGCILALTLVYTHTWNNVALQSILKGRMWKGEDQDWHIWWVSCWLILNDLCDAH